ncbi:hypothetical protein ACTSKR_09505 [Chitinibacteraceae bacterium HSL-7]
MKTKICWAFAPDTGASFGPTVAFADPMGGPDDFHLPAHATFIEPPEVAAGEWPFWVGDKWEVRAVVVDAVKA